MHRNIESYCSDRLRTVDMEKGDSGSIIAELEKSSAYPRVERLVSGSELKITKTNFREMLERLIKEDYI